MSRLGKKSVAIPAGVTLKMEGDLITVSGPKGTLQYRHMPEVTVRVEESAVSVDRKGDTPKARAMHGLTRALLANMLQGVSQGYEKQLEIIGVGYKAQSGKTLKLHLGFSCPIEYPVPPGIEITQDEKNKNMLSIRGIDKQLVGQVAAEIRSMRPPEPYKGKGIRYMGEVVRRKVGKAAATGKAAA